MSDIYSFTPGERVLFDFQQVAPDTGLTETFQDAGIVRDVRETSEGPKYGVVVGDARYHGVKDERRDVVYLSASDLQRVPATLAVNRGGNSSGSPSVWDVAPA